MRNEGADIVQDNVEELKEATENWKEKAKLVGTAAWDATRATYTQLHDKTLAYGHATDQAIREKPYMALGIAFGAGLLIGLLAGRNGRSYEEDED
jgi:ElaB/YqjD/DUF883 family membrane-anchored ribosome-binding protein